jgi:hypothetical protein
VFCVGIKLLFFSEGKTGNEEFRCLLEIVLVQESTEVASGY